MSRRTAHAICFGEFIATSNAARSLPYNRAMSHLDILLPLAFPPAPLSSDLLKELRLPALAMLIARCTSPRAQCVPEDFDGFHRALPHEIWLSHQFRLQQTDQDNGSPPIATALMREFGIEAGAGFWFILQPVHIHVARDHLVLTDPRQLMLEESQARILFDVAKPLFDEVGMDLIYGNPDTWFVRADDWAELQTATPDAASGHNIDIWMPKGPTERSWRKIQNEVQMHWHDHPVNQEREMHRLKPVNSLWLWGGASVATRPEHAPYKMAFGLCGWTKAFRQCVPRYAQASTAIEVLAAAPESGLVLLDALIEPALSEDWSRWLDQMHELETRWFAPLLNALKLGTIEQLSLVLTHHSRLTCFTSTRSSLRKFWIKPSLAALQS